MFVVLAFSRQSNPRAILGPTGRPFMLNGRSNNPLVTPGEHAALEAQGRLFSDREAARAAAGRASGYYLFRAFELEPHSAGFRVGAIQQTGGEPDPTRDAVKAHEMRNIQRDAEACAVLVTKVKANVAKVEKAATEGNEQACRVLRSVRAELVRANMRANQAAARAGWKTLPEGVEPDGMFFATC